MKNLIKIAEHYGYVSQSHQLIEEMAELTVAIHKRERWNGVRPKELHYLDKNIAEEIADVEIMLAQIKYLRDCEDAVNVYKAKKIERQMKRIGGSR